MILTAATSVRRLVAREGRLRAVDADLPEFLLEEGDVVREGLEELLGVQGGHDDAAVDLDVGLARHNTPEVDDELARRMDDVREVDVLALRHGVVEHDPDLLLLFFHRRSIPRVGRAKFPLVHVDQGSINSGPSPSKWRTLCVAIAAFRATAMPAIWR